jgi:hypothetical protein
MWAIIQVGINGSNFMSPGEADLLDQAEVESVIYGSKMTLVTEIFTIHSDNHLVRQSMYSLHVPSINVSIKRDVPNPRLMINNY